MELLDGVGLINLAVLEVERLDVEGVLEAEDVVRRVGRRFEAVREELVSSLRCEPFGTVPDREEFDSSERRAGFELPVKGKRRREPICVSVDSIPSKSRFVPISPAGQVIENS